MVAVTSTMTATAATTNDDNVAAYCHTANGHTHNTQHITSHILPLLPASTVTTAAATSANARAIYELTIVGLVWFGWLRYLLRDIHTHTQQGKDRVR